MAVLNGIPIPKLKDSVFVYLHNANLFVASKSAFMVLLHHEGTCADKHRVAKNGKHPTGTFPAKVEQGNVLLS